MKKHKIWLELLAKEPTESGAIPLKDSIKIINELSDVAKKHKFDAYIRGIPKEIIDYKPSGETIVIKNLSDIVEKLTPDQFEMFVIDLRSWVEHARQIYALKQNATEFNKIFKENFGAEMDTEKNWEYITEGMRWLDTGEHKQKTVIHIES